MSRLIAAAAIAIALAPAATTLATITASKAFAATGVKTLKTYSLGCEIAKAGFADVRNTLTRRIPRGTPIALVIVVERSGNRLGVPMTVTVKQEFGHNTFHAFPGLPSGAKSCTATVKLAPDVVRR